MPFPHLPKPVYETLPSLYMIGGTTSALWSDNAAGVVAGLLLAIAGWQVRAIRQQARAEHAEQQAHLDARLRRARKVTMNGVRR